MKYFFNIFTFIFNIFLISCKDGSTPPAPSPPPSPEFSFRVTVKDLNENPVPGLRISGGNIIPVEIIPGYRAVALGIYKLRMAAELPPMNAIVFQDSIYMIYGEADMSRAVLGYTSANGTFECNNQLRFPSVLNPPLFSSTTVNGETSGWFKIIDTAKIVLKDTSKPQYPAQIFYQAIKPGINEFHIIWNPLGESKMENNNRTSSSSSYKVFPPPPNKFCNQINIQDASGSSQSLYLVEEGSINPEICEMPPPPPAGSFDVRFVSSRMCEV